MRRDKAEPFFRFARERHAVYLRRSAGAPAPWTNDPTLQEVRFTNIYRELDRTTVWFRKHIRQPLHDQRWVVPATVIFRWFNRITTGEVLLESGILSPNFDLKVFEKNLRKKYPTGPWVTGSYVVYSGKIGADKLTGIIKLLQRFLDWWAATGEKAFYSSPQKLGLQSAHELLQVNDGLSGFSTYEVVTDLRWTKAIRPDDKLQWAHVGPGAMRGISRLLYGEPDKMNQDSWLDQQLALKEMRSLLELTKDSAFLPQTDIDWPHWEMREVEHTLCEFDKYERVRRCQGRPKNKYDAKRAEPLPAL